MESSTERRKSRVAPIRVPQSSSGATRSAYVGVTIAPLAASAARRCCCGAGFVVGDDVAPPPQAASITSVRISECATSRIEYGRGVFVRSGRRVLLKVISTPREAWWDVAPLVDRPRTHRHLAQ